MDRIRFSIESDKEANQKLFALDERSGELKLNGKLDAEEYGNSEKN